jgi:hypothetical protein
MSMEETHRVPVEFKGRGDLKGWKFTLMHREDLPAGGALAVYRKTMRVADSEIASYEAVKLKVTHGSWKTSGKNQL